VHSDSDPSELPRTLTFYGSMGLVNRAKKEDRSLHIPAW